MTNTDTRDVDATVSQIQALAAAGCELVRVAVLDMAAAESLRAIRDRIALPLVADIHFDSRLAVAAMEHGAQGVRLNPGNIGGRDKLRRVVDAAKSHGVAIRVGVNSGSIEKDLLRRHGFPTPEKPHALVESAMRNIGLLEEMGFCTIKVSIKASDPMTTVSGYRALSRRTDYPLHLGVTEAGGLVAGTVKSSVALGILLHEGIGDTLRVSLTADPVEEMPVAYGILRALGIRSRGPEIVSCPTCGRTRIDLFTLSREVERAVATMKSNIKVAVMGCVVNGPGEAREADIGLAGGNSVGIIFKKGKIFRKVAEDELLAVFLEELKKMDQS